MKKNYIFKATLFLIPFSALVLMSSSGGRDDGKTGSPGDGGVTCSQCHSGGDFGLSPTITTNIPAAGYEVNTAYTITVTGAASAAGGFQLTAEKLSDNSKVGTFTAGTGSRVTGQRITHSNLSNSSWTFTWTSPGTAQSNIKFYAAVNAANGDGGTGGDEIATTSTGSLHALEITADKQLDFEMYPNPSSDFIKIQLPSGILNGTVKIMDIRGRVLQTTRISSISFNEIDVRNLSKGMYLLKIESDSKIGLQQFIKK